MKSDHLHYGFCNLSDKLYDWARRQTEYHKVIAGILRSVSTVSSAATFGLLCLLPFLPYNNKEVLVLMATGEDTIGLWKNERNFKSGVLTQTQLGFHC